MPSRGHRAGTIKYAATLKAVQHYFGEIEASNIRVLGAKSSFFGAVHAKQLIVDGKTAVNIASPFESPYFGDDRHLIDDPRRGNSDHLPIHDVSIVVTGPAAADAHDSPRTALLRDGIDAGASYFVNEEEVAQTGTTLGVAYNRARRGDGRVAVWLSTSRGTGRGEGSSGLAFDLLTNTTGTDGS